MEVVSYIHHVDECLQHMLQNLLSVYFMPCTHFFCKLSLFERDSYKVRVVDVYRPKYNSANNF